MNDTSQATLEQLRWRIDANTQKLGKLEGLDLPTLKRDVQDIDERLEKVEAMRPQLIAYRMEQLEKRMTRFTTAVITLTVTIVGSTVGLAFALTYGGH